MFYASIVVVPGDMPIWAFVVVFFVWVLDCLSALSGIPRIYSLRPIKQECFKHQCSVKNTLILWDKGST
uniref:Uncharacterized protein n=1 Tax=Aegilops tauschii subsp. strangulata TaxID=200361 RepID=A0A453B9Z1_AEGTS